MSNLFPESNYHLYKACQCSETLSHYKTFEAAYLKEGRIKVILKKSYHRKTTV
jgi:hypothetical protein